MAEQRYWWDAYGPFDPDEDGYPNAGQVVRHYRLLKGWTPADLGEAISRRRALARILGIPPLLLGLAAFGAPGPTPDSSQQGNAPAKVRVDDATLAQYDGFLRLYWELDYTSTARESLDDIRRWARHLGALANDAGDGQRRRLVALLCRYDQLATWIARDQRDYQTALPHANRAIKLARATGDDELLAAALFRRGRTFLEQEQIEDAIRDLDAAVPHAHRARPQLKALVLLAAGHARAHAAAADRQATEALTLIDQAGRIVRRGHLEDDESFVKLNAGRYHLDRAGALLALGRPTDALDELDLAVRGVAPDQTRRHAYINVLRAKAHADIGELPVAVAVAEEALQVSKALRSGVNVARIGQVYEQVRASTYGTSPQVARLGAQLVQR